MIRVKDEYISIKDIKSIKYVSVYCDKFLVIKYSFDDEEIKIDVDDIDEYFRLAEEIMNAVNRRLEVVA